MQILWMVVSFALGYEAGMGTEMCLASWRRRRGVDDAMIEALCALEERVEALECLGRGSKGGAV